MRSVSNIDSTWSHSTLGKIKKDAMLIIEIGLKILKKIKRTFSYNRQTDGKNISNYKLLFKI